MISASTYALYRVLSIHGSVHLSQNNRILWSVRSVQLLSLISASTLGLLDCHHQNSKFGTGATISAETYFFLDYLKFVAPKSLTSCFVLKLFWCELLLSWHSVTHVARILDSCTLPACDDCSTFARNQWEGINHSLEDKWPDMWFKPICKHTLAFQNHHPNHFFLKSASVSYMTQEVFRVLHDSYIDQCSQLYAESLPEAHMGPMLSIFSAVSLSCLLSLVVGQSLL